MFYPFFVVPIDDDGDDVEPYVIIVLKTIDEAICCPDKVSLFKDIDGGFWLDEISAASGLHLDNNYGVAVFCYDVYFFMAIRPISFYNLIATFDEIIDSYLLA